MTGASIPKVAPAPHRAVTRDVNRFSRRGLHAGPLHQRIVQRLAATGPSAQRSLSPMEMRISMRSPSKAGPAAPPQPRERKAAPASAIPASTASTPSATLPAA